VLFLRDALDPVSRNAGAGSGMGGTGDGSGVGSGLGGCGSGAGKGLGTTSGPPSIGTTSIGMNPSSEGRLSDSPNLSSFTRMLTEGTKL
jgi:hypothetical protein